MVFLLLSQVATMHRRAVQKLRGMEEWKKVRPAFTCNLWRSRTRREYFLMTMHWIDETRRHDGHANCQWQLRSRCLGSVPVEAESITAAGEGLCRYGCNGYLCDRQ